MERIPERGLRREEEFILPVSHVVHSRESSGLAFLVAAISNESSEKTCKKCGAPMVQKKIKMGFATMLKWVCTDKACENSR